MDDQKQEPSQPQIANTPPLLQSPIHPPGHLIEPNVQPSNSPIPTSTVESQGQTLTPTQTQITDQYVPEQSFVGTQQTEGQHASGKSKNIMLLGIVVAVIIIAGGSAYAFLGHKKQSTSVVSTKVQSSTSSSAAGSSSKTSASSLTGYEAVIQEFITAIQNNDKKTADSLQSPAFSQSNQTQAGTTSFYSACQSAGVFCTGAFAKSYLATATKTTKTYTAVNGVKGEEDNYTVTTASNTGSSTSNSTNTVTIAVVPSGNTWLVDYVNEGGSSSANGT